MPLGQVLTQGTPYETITDLKGVVQLDGLDKAHAVVLIQDNKGALNIDTIDLP